MTPLNIPVLITTGAAPNQKVIKALLICFLPGDATNPEPLAIFEEPTGQYSYCAVWQIKRVNPTKQ